ncbi:MAG: cell division protein FtsX [Gemmatimonadota bacterium]
MPYTTREAFFAFSRAPLLTLLSIVTITFSLFSLGVFGLLVLNIERTLASIEERIEVIAYLEDHATPQQVDSLRMVLGARPEVARVTFVSRAEALERARSEMPENVDLFADLEVNPLPASLEVSLRPGSRNDAAVSRLGRALEGYGYVEEVQYGREWVRKLDFLRDVFLGLGIATGAVFAAISFVVISSTIKLVLLSRAEEIEIMKVVGATGTFIAKPFLVEGLAKGAIGGLGALALTFAAYALVNENVVRVSFYSPDLAAGALVMGGLLGMAASYLSLRHHLVEW